MCCIDFGSPEDGSFACCADGTCTHDFQLIRLARYCFSTALSYLSRIPLAPKIAQFTRSIGTMEIGSPSSS